MQTIALLFCLMGFNGSQAADHVILISIDGFRPDFYRQATWPAPNLQHMAANGVSADFVRGVFPSVTYPSHTTMITGAKPAKHGVYYNSPFEPEGWTGKWYWYEEQIQTVTLWDAAQAGGKTSASFSWPVSVNAPITYNLPEIWPLDDVDDYYAWWRQFEQPKGLMDELAKNAIGDINDHQFNAYTLSRDIRIIQAASYIFRTKKPNLMTIHLLQTDFAQHDYGREGFEVRRAVANADVAVGLLWESIQRAGLAERTALVVTGDHGFVDIHTQIHPNNWLVDAGLREKERKGDNWRATFHTTGSGSFLILRDPDDAEAVVAKVEKHIANLRPGVRKLFQVLDREALAKVGGPTDAVMGLSPIEGIKISGRIGDGDVTPATKKGDHGHLPAFDDIHTGFVAYGAGLKSGVSVPLMGLEDVAPVVAHLLGLDFKAPDGVLHYGFFQEKSP